MFVIDPVLFIAWEGFFGMMFLATILFILNFIPGLDHGKFENAPYAISQIKNDFPLLIGVIGSIVSYLLCEIFSLIITKRIDSVTRSTINSMRSICIWVIYF
jgi:hypothetical protein